jgi:hypothetical protein
MQCTDYAVMRQARQERADDWPDPAGWDGLVPIGPHVLVGRLPASETEEFIAACLARGPNFNPTPQSPIRYTFVRRDAPEGASTWHWDDDKAIQRAVALSRLVRDNSHCLDVAVRTVEGWSNEHRQIAPLDIEARAYAYRVITGERDYLDQQDAGDLNELVTTYYAVQASLPARVEHAFWLAEYMTRSPYLLVAYIHVVSALESLLNTSTERASTQFVRRTRGLASELGIALSGTAARRIYDLRSHAVHGVDVDWKAGGKESELLVAAQALLRGTIRRCIEDPAFAGHFTTEATVDSKWPIT